MPSTSQSQQSLFGMALAYKRGDAKSASKEVKKLAANTSEDELEKFAKTKRTGLPKKKAKEGSMPRRIINGFIDKNLQGMSGIKRPIKEVETPSTILSKDAFTIIKNAIYETRVIPTIREVKILIYGVIDYLYVKIQAAPAVSVLNFTKLETYIIGSGMWGSAEKPDTEFKRMRHRIIVAFMADGNSRVISSLIAGVIETIINEMYKTEAHLSTQHINLMRKAINRVFTAVVKSKKKEEPDEETTKDTETEEGYLPTRKYTAFRK